MRKSDSSSVPVIDEENLQRVARNEFTRYRIAPGFDDGVRGFDVAVAELECLVELLNLIVTVSEQQASLLVGVGRGFEDEVEGDVEGLQSEMQANISRRIGYSGAERQKPTSWVTSPSTTQPVIILCSRVNSPSRHTSTSQHPSTSIHHAQQLGDYDTQRERSR